MGQRQHPQTDAMLASLRGEKVATWFDLGLFLDRLREDGPPSAFRAPAGFPTFRRDVAAGVGFLTFNFGIDYLDMRGPKIAIGLDDEGTLVVLALNGRIRESVGATHVDMAKILLKHGMRSAMGFDPGGSATLVVGTAVLNISPYNHDYERNVYSLPPEPRSVANVVVGY